MANKSLGTFTEWMTREIARVQKVVDKLGSKHVRDDEEDDPHRLVDYSIKKRRKQLR